MIFYTKFVGAIRSRNDQVCNFWCNFWELRRCIGSLLHILISFFLHLKMIWKELHINIIMVCTHGKKIKVFRALLSIPIATFPFQRMYKYRLIEHLSSILSTMAFSQENCNFCWSFFPRKAYLSLLSFQRWWLSKLFHTNEELCLLRELVKKIRDMLKYPWSFRG